MGDLGDRKEIVGKALLIKKRAERHGSSSASRISSTMTVQPRTRPSDVQSLASRQSERPRKRYNVVWRLAVVLRVWRDAAWRAKAGLKGYGLLAKEQRSAAMARSKRCPASMAAF